MWQGRVVTIHIAPQASAPMVSVPEVRAVTGRGLEGDRYFLGTGFYSQRSSYGGREVTLIETETLDALFDGVVNADGRTLGIKLDPGQSRRNIATVGVPLNHLVGRQFRVGQVRMRGTRLCEPCKHLEELSWPGVMGGLVHRGGLRAQILADGLIRVGDPIEPAD